MFCQFLRHTPPLRWNAALVVALILSGCATKYYSEPELPKPQVAIISVVSSGVWIFRVDGLYLNNSHRRVKVLPGKHRFDVHMRYIHLCIFRCSSGSTLDGVIDLDVKAGRSYTIDMSGEGFFWTKVFIWAIDEATGEIVAGVKPPPRATPGRWRLRVW